MSATAFATIQAALLAALNATVALAGGRISANRLRPIPVGQNTAIVLRLDAASGSEQVIGVTDWQTQFDVECYARASAAADAAAAVDALLFDAWARLCSLDFSALGASVSLQPKIDWQYDDLDSPTCCAIIHLSAQHQTTTASLAART